MVADCESAKTAMMRRKERRGLKVQRGAWADMAVRMAVRFVGVKIRGSWRFYGRFVRRFMRTGRAEGGFVQL